MTSKLLPTLLPTLAFLAGCGPEPRSVGPDAPPPEILTGVFETNRGELELPYQLVDGHAVFQGDILLPLERARTFAAGRDIPTWEWPNNTIPYLISSTLPMQQRVTDAIAHWESNTSIRFVQRTNQTSYVIFASGTGCSSSVGRQFNNVQYIYLDVTCSTGNAIHEIGHTVGLWHEQSRADRDSHITVQWSNILASWQPQFAVYADGDDYGLYDIGSIMHYPGTGSTAAIDSLLPTMTRTDGTEFSWQRDGLSDIDRASVEEMYSQGFGRALATGDFNGDGYQDVAVGTPRRQPQLTVQFSGVVRIYRGSAVGLVFSQEISQSMFPTALGITHDRFGFSVTAGDFNGDGYADLAVGAPGENPTNLADPSLDNSGLVYVFTGGTGALAATQIVSQQGLGTAEGGDRFGASLAAGDFNNDGRDDLAVGAPGEGPNSTAVRSGVVFAYRGTNTGLTAWRTLDQTGLGTNEAGDGFGWSLATGDFNGDGRSDLAVGAPTEKADANVYSGHVFTFHGTATGFTPGASIAESALATPTQDDYFGAALATGDLNGDGRSDLAVGAPGRAVSGLQAAGQVFLYRGSATGLAAHSTFTQSAMGTNERADGFGAALACGDVDHDGKADLAVGAPGEGPSGLSVGSGYTYVFKGAASGVTGWIGLDQTGLGTNESGDRFGAALAFGDFNHDGRSDLVAGAPGETPPSNVQSGWAFAFRGSAAGPVAWTAFGP